MLDEQLLEFIDSVESSVESVNESFDSEDSVADPTYYAFDNIQTDLLEEDVQQEECVQNVGVASFDIIYNKSIRER